jgi:glutamate racemase
VRASRSGRIGVIATAGTIRSGAYVRAITAEAPDAQVTARACPLFVPLVEEGWTNHEATWSVAREYLAPFVHDEVDTLVLGCTHYPLLKSLIGEIIGRGVRLRRRSTPSACSPSIHSTPRPARGATGSSPRTTSSSSCR